MHEHLSYIDPQDQQYTKQLGVKAFFFAFWYSTGVCNDEWFHEK